MLHSAFLVARMAQLPGTSMCGCMGVGQGEWGKGIDGLHGIGPSKICSSRGQQTAAGSTGSNRQHKGVWLADRGCTTHLACIEEVYHIPTLLGSGNMFLTRDLLPVNYGTAGVGGRGRRRGRVGGRGW